jgi:cobaltochelatase CobS
MYHILSTNIQTIASEGLQAKEREISVVVKTSDIEKGTKEPKLYAFRYGMIYDPADEFSPNIKGKQRISDFHVESFYQQLPEARTSYNNLLSKISKGGNDSGEKEKLLLDIKAKEIRIQEQAAKIAELSAKIPSVENNGQIQQLEKMIKALSDIHENRIEIVINGTSKNFEKIVHEKFLKILSLVIEDKEAVYCYGPAGTGKSQLAEDVAKAAGLQFYPASTLTQEFKLSGYEDAGGRYHETNFYRAFTKGGLFFLDEMDSSVEEVLVGINGALANGYYDFPMGTEYAHKDFRVIAAGNTIGRGGDERYTGRNALDLSTLDRFLGIEIDYSPNIDKAVALNDMELIEFARAIRKASDNSGIAILCSYRSISKIAKLKEKFDLIEVLKMALIKGVAADDVRMLARNMDIKSDNKYYKALKQAA